MGHAASKLERKVTRKRRRTLSSSDERQQVPSFEQRPVITTSPKDQQVGLSVQNISFGPESDSQTLPSDLLQMITGGPPGEPLISSDFMRRISESLGTHESSTSSDALAKKQPIRIGTFIRNRIGRDNFKIKVVNYLSGPEPPSSVEPPGWSNPGLSKKDITAWLQPSEFGHLYRSSFEQRLPNTGAWFIYSPEFRILLDAQNVVLWVIGTPGSGKSVLSAIATKQLQSVFQPYANVAVTYIFLRYDEPCTTRSVLAGLLDQLVNLIPIIHSLVSGEYIRSKAQGHDELTEKELCDCLLAALAEEELEKVFIVIDGLNEAPDEVKHGLLRFLPTAGANLLIVSRPLGMFYRYTPHAHFVVIEPRTKDNQHLIDDRIRSHVRLRCVLDANPSLTDVVRSKVLEKAQGVMLVARLQMDVVCCASSASTINSALDTVRPGLTEMYQYTLERIARQSETDVSIAHRALTWVRHAEVPLTQVEIERALAISPDTFSFEKGGLIGIRHILEACKGLLFLGSFHADPESGFSPKVYFIHHTVEEFLDTITFSKLPPPQTLIAASCLAYWASPAHQEALSWSCDANPPPKKFWGPPVDTIKTVPFLKFAERHWGKHAERSQAEGPLHNFILDTLLVKSKVFHHLPAGGKLGDPRLVVSGLHLAAQYGLVDVITAGKGVVNYGFVDEAAGGDTPLHWAVRRRNLRVVEAILETYKEPMEVRQLDEDRDGDVRETRLLEERPWNMGDDGGSGSASGFFVSQTEISRSEQALMIHDKPWDDETEPELQANTQYNLEVSSHSPNCEQAGEHHRKPDQVLPVNAQNHLGQTPLHLIRTRIETSDSDYRSQVELQIISHFLQQPGIDVNIQDQNGVTAFWNACNQGRFLDDYDKGRAALLYTEVSTLNADVWERRNGNTAFMEACRWGIESVVDWFLAKYAGDDDAGRLLHRTNAQGDNALMCLCRIPNTHTNAKLAARKDVPHVRVAQRLLDRDPSIAHQRNVHGQTALMLAARSGQIAVLNILLSLTNEAEYMNQQDCDGYTALVHAFQERQDAVAAILLAQDSLDPCIQSYRNMQRGVTSTYTALSWACRHNTLLDKGPQSRDQPQMLSRVNYLRSVDLLLSKTRWSRRKVYDTMVEELVLRRAGLQSRPALFHLLLLVVHDDDLKQEKQKKKRTPWTSRRKRMIRMMKNMDAVNLLVHVLWKRCETYLKLVFAHLGITAIMPGLDPTNEFCECVGCDGLPPWDWKLDVEQDSRKQTDVVRTSI